jgi:hypothetical protein
VKGKKQISRLRRLHMQYKIPPAPRAQTRTENSQVVGPPVGVIGPIGLIRLQVVFLWCGSVLVFEMASTSKCTALLVPLLLNEMVAVRNISRLRRVVIQRSSSLKAKGAAEKGCTKVLQGLFF